MISLGIYLLVYLFGGLTFLPGILITFWYVYAKNQKADKEATGYPPEAYTGINEHQGKNGWIRLITLTADMSPVPIKKSFSFTKTVASMSGNTIHPSRSGNEENSDRHTYPKKSRSPFSFSSSSSSLFYAILRHGTLFCFDNELEKTCHLIIPMHEYTLSLYPKEGKKESELFGRTMSICLTPKSNNNNNTSHYYISCSRSIDKEDWYLALKAATVFLSEGDLKDAHHGDWRDSTLYDTRAMTKLQGQLNSTPAQLESQCWNALMGRLFLGIYKTEHWRQLWHNKMKNKLDKMNAYQRLQLQQQQQHQLQQHSMDSNKKRSMMKLSPFQLELISMGETIPCLTETKLVEFSADGNCVIQGQVDYDGDFLVVVRTDFRYLWPAFASTFERKKKTAIATPSATVATDSTGAGSLPVILSIKLRRFSGKVIFKVKPPPSGRVWVAFESVPHMEWQVTPIVLDKQIKWSLVTNMIQAKIEEMVMESLVMPNMEDFPFFDSDGLGGIFGERIPTKDGPGPTTTNELDHNAGNVNTMEDEKQQLPTVSKLVQGYINRIKTTYKNDSGHPDA